MLGDGWVQCAGYLDERGPMLSPGDDVPSNWGAACALQDYTKVRMVCGPNVGTYRYLTVRENVFVVRSGHRRGFITEARDQDGNEWQYHSNDIYGDDQRNSYWGGGQGCGPRSEDNRNLNINNEHVFEDGSMCPWEISNCFGQNLNGNRYLWVYIKR